ncbi:small secreted domain DUF320 [Streptomyces sp. 3212.3]|nr:small secreted domain DUF320 [Streptomyces sp. 3212.3]
MKLRKMAAVAAGMVVALGAAAPAMADSGAQGSATGSPGILSGNVIQVPIDIPVNVCGNTVNVIGLLNPAAGNTCANGADITPTETAATTPAATEDDTVGTVAPEDDASSIADCLCRELATS